MKSSAKTNYWIDITIGVALIVAAVSGLVLFLGPLSGYQGGRNPGYGRTVLFMDHSTWATVHAWSSITMAVGTLGHLVLHWNWLTCMTRKMISKTKRRKTGVKTASCPIPTT